MNRQRRGKARAAGNRKDGANPALKAVLIYENLVAGVRARGFLQKLAYGSNRTLEEQMWKFDALGIRELRHAAASAARRADVVVVSVSAKLELPGAVRAWFDIWLRLLEEEDPALVALLDLSTTPNRVPICNYLSCIAGRARIEFFVVCREMRSSPVFGVIQEGIWAKSAEQAVLSCLKTKGSVPSTLASRLPRHCSAVTRTGTGRR
jgi:hypothetical protein